MTDCRVTIEGRLGRITLDRRNALNALTPEMVSDLTAALTALAADPTVERVMIDSAVPGVFCAGGDIKMVRAMAASGRYEDALDFFRAEFALNRMIAEFPKPYIALIDGVCFGGGMGLSIHGRYRAVTDRATFAMPEVAIGYFPDVGASYFLSRLPPGVGLWLGLTGHRVKAGSALKMGLATHCVAAEELDLLARALAESASPVDDVLDSFSRNPTDTGEPGIDRIAGCFHAGSLQEVLSNLDRSQGQAEKACAELLRKSSSLSATLTFSLIVQAEASSLQDCLARELSAANVAVRHSDFVEGVRALLVDKDRNPRWLRTVAEWEMDGAGIAAFGE